MTLKVSNPEKSFFDHLTPALETNPIFASKNEKN